MFEQRLLDRQHKTYRIESFPLKIEEADIAAWVHAITGTLRPSSFYFGASPTIVFEVWSDKDGITHRLKIPWQHDSYIIRQLQSHLPGVRITAESRPPEHRWKHAVEVGLKHNARTLHINSPTEMSRTVMAAFQQLRGQERLLMQWVVTPAIRSDPPEHNKTRTTELSLNRLARGSLLATRDEINERRKKLEEPNMLAVLRVAADDSTTVGAENLIHNVRKAISSSRGSRAYFAKTLPSLFMSQDVLVERIRNALAPFYFPIRLSLTELTALMGWPIGDSLIPGVTISMSRHLPPAAIISSTGRVLGKANMPGSQRNLATTYSSAVRHTYLLGRSGVGKTVTLTNMAAQDMERGYGLIVIEAKDDLFNQTLERIPTARLEDVIILDVNDSVRPVGFNIFDQGNSRTAIDEICALIDGMYRDSSQSITAPRMLYNMTHALAEVPGSTFIDLPVLMSPADKTTPDGMWRDYIARQVRNPQVRAYLQAFLNLSPSEQDRQAAPLYNRIWEFTSRPEIRAILGQRTSSFNMKDVIKDNKILLVNLSGSRVGQKTASLAGTFLVNSIWQAVRSVTPEKPNFLYLDEFSDFLNLPVDTEDMLAKARSAKLGMVLAHQNLAQLPPKLRDGVMANTATKMVFRVSARDSGPIAREFGRYVDETDFIGLPQYEAIAMIATDTGSTPPVSIATLPPGKSTGNARRARYQSQRKYGRALADVERDNASRKVPEAPKRQRPKISGEDWGV